MAEELANVEDQSYDVSKLEGVEKAAILLLSLSEEDAAQILKHLEPKQVQKLGSEMAKVDDMTQTKITAVHKHFIEEIQNYSTIGFQSQDFVKRALTAALGEDKAANLIDQILMGSGAKGLDSLKWMDSKQVASIIRNEHPQIQTIVLSYLEPEQSAEILAQFPEKVRLDLLMRIANLEEVQPAALQELNEIMEKQFAGQAGTQAAKMGGLKSAANIMNYLDTSIEGQLMDAIREQDEEMSQQIQDLMFVFDNLIDVETKAFRLFFEKCSKTPYSNLLKVRTKSLKTRSCATCQNVRPKCLTMTLRRLVQCVYLKLKWHRKKFFQWPVDFLTLAKLCLAAVAAKSSCNSVFK